MLRPLASSQQQRTGFCHSPSRHGSTTPRSLRQRSPALAMPPHFNRGHSFTSPPAAQSLARVLHPSPMWSASASSLPPSRRHHTPTTRDFPLPNTHYYMNNTLILSFSPRYSRFNRSLSPSPRNTTTRPYYRSSSLPHECSMPPPDFLNAPHPDTFIHHL